MSKKKEVAGWFEVIAFIAVMVMAITAFVAAIENWSWRSKHKMPMHGMLRYDGEEQFQYYIENSLGGGWCCVESELRKNLGIKELECLQSGGHDWKYVGKNAFVNIAYFEDIHCFICRYCEKKKHKNYVDLTPEEKTAIEVLGINK